MRPLIFAAVTLALSTPAGARDKPAHLLDGMFGNALVVSGPGFENRFYFHRDGTWSAQLGGANYNKLPWKDRLSGGTWKIINGKVCAEGPAEPGEVNCAIGAERRKVGDAWSSQEEHHVDGKLHKMTLNYKVVGGR